MHAITYCPLSWNGLGRCYINSSWLQNIKNTMVVYSYNEKKNQHKQPPQIMRHDIHTILQKLYMFKKNLIKSSWRFDSVEEGSWKYMISQSLAFVDLSLVNLTFWLFTKLGFILFFNDSNLFQIEWGLMRLSFTL